MRALRFLVLAIVVLVVLAVTACGRSSLEEELGTTSIVTTSCGPSTCPDGCCDGAGLCRTGGDVRACGAGGGRCSDCVAGGYTLCTDARACGRDDPRCGPDSCSGCCAVDDGRLRCLAGNAAGACGQAGASCADCRTEGRACEASTRSCGTSRCTPDNCNGCCVNDRCLTGTVGAACGSRGAACTSCASGQACAAQPGGGGVCTGDNTCGPTTCSGCCTATGTCVTGRDTTSCGRGGQLCAPCDAGESCAASGANGGSCQAQTACSPATCKGCCVGNQCVTAPTAAACGTGGVTCQACPDGQVCDPFGRCIPTTNTCGLASCAGCCVGDICAVGTQSTACGVAGDACVNCTLSDRVCEAGICELPACSPASCTGCCDGNTCVTGTLNSACGASGAACDVCPNGEFCDNLVSPRRCSGDQDTCPATYGACPVGVRTPVTPTLQGVCSDAQLDVLAAACTSAPDSLACTSAFNALGGACSACIAPFRVPFARNAGLWRCAAPEVNQACRRNTGCAADCAETSCEQCDAAANGACHTIVDGPGGQCSGFVVSTSCAANALRPGAFCSQFSYPSFGAWFRAVGDRFCGNGP